MSLPRTLLCFAGCLLLLTACTDPDGRRDIRSFYFPVMDLQGGQVYEYALQTNGTTVSDYWYYKSFVRDSGVFLAATNYDQFFQVNQITRELITPTGAVARDYLLYEQDTVRGVAVQAPAQLIAPDVFPFSVKDSLGVFLFNVSYHPVSDPESNIYLIRNRRYIGDGPPFQFKGKNYATIRMAVKEAIGNEKEGSAEIEGSGEEWYAQTLGLVYFIKKYGKNGEITREYRLKDIFDMTELERRGATTTF